jgi:AcrR family transcriptional regulator
MTFLLREYVRPVAFRVEPGHKALLTARSSSAYGFEKMNRRLTARGCERRQQIMAYATKRFADNGYHPTSVAEIVTGLGVGKGVFYWYFSSKEELFREILADAQMGLRRRQREAIGEEPDPVERIVLGIRATMAWLDQHRDLFTLVRFARSDERFAPMLRRGQAIAVTDAVQHVEAAISAGHIADVDPLVMTHAILGVTDSLAINFIFERGNDPEDVADAAVAFCLNGLRG